MRYAMAACLFAVLGMINAGAAQEENRILPVPQSGVEIREESIRVNVTENVARKNVRMVFYNPGGRTEVDLFFEVDPSERVEALKVNMGGKEMAAELLEGDKARSIYEQIVRQQRDPALLENYGSNLIRVRVFPVPSRSEFTTEIELIQKLRVEGGLARLTGVTTLSKLPRSKVFWQIDIRGDEGVGTVFSPTHDIDVARRSAGHVVASYERSNAKGGAPLVLYYSLAPRDAAVLSHNGHFMLTITPPEPDREPMPRDIVFVVDTSGSMLEDDKIGQVRKALSHFVKTIGKRDRFNIIAYSTEARKFRDGFVGAGDLEAAEEFIRNLQARGGTNIEEALQLAQKHDFRGEAVPIIVFLSDGIATIGQRDTKQLVKICGGKARIFCFGVGYDVNTQLLDLLAIKNGGDRQFLHPKEEVTKVLERYAMRIQEPVLSNPVIEIAGATEIYPKRLPDVFRGGEIAVFGRATGEGKVTLKADGFFCEYDVIFPKKSEYDFVPRLWAIQKVDFLLDEIRERGTNPELVREVVRLAKEHMIVTPYTSYLIVEDAPPGDVRPVTAPAGGVRRSMDESAAAGFSGRREVEKERNRAVWRAAKSVERMERAANEVLDAEGRDKDICRQIADRSFVRQSERWVDARYDGKGKIQEVKFLSEEYFKLLRRNPEAGKFMSLGDDVTFRCEEEWVRVRK